MSKVSQTVLLTTDAPADWPEVRVDAAALGDNAEAGRAERVLRFVTAAEAAFRESGVQTLEANVLRITAKGVVDVHLRVQAGKEQRDLFFYPDADPWAAGHYEALCELAGRSLGRLRPVFYSNDDLSMVFPDPVDSVARRDKLYLSAALFPAKGEYAMWWAREQGEQFHYSPTFEHYDRLYREVSGLEFSAFAVILTEIGIIQDEEEVSKSSLQDRNVEIPLEGPEGVPMIVSFSQQRGLRFHFHTGRTSHEYRDLFLQLLIERIKLWKKTFGSKPHTLLDTPPMQWWRRLSQRLRETPSEQAIGAVGKVEKK
ncbi:MAG: hypothetical protein SFU83_11310 [Meiothermus sp.]|nr:hypothetical protein [Meiothermus sp.]